MHLVKERFVAGEKKIFTDKKFRKADENSRQNWPVIINDKSAIKTEEQPVNNWGRFRNYLPVIGIMEENYGQIIPISFKMVGVIRAVKIPLTVRPRLANAPYLRLNPIAVEAPTA